MKNSKERRPCSEISLEISHIVKNIEHIQKNINSSICAGEDLATLHRNMEWQNERLAEMKEKLNDCE